MPQSVVTQPERKVRRITMSMFVFSVYEKVRRLMRAVGPTHSCGVEPSRTYVNPPIRLEYRPY